MSLNRSIVPAFAIVLAALLSACETDYYVSNNSSQGDNDYFEEPISERSEKYAPALELSNQFIEHFSTGDIEAIRQLMDPRLRELAPADTLQTMHETVASHYGPVVEFKPMQWGFATHTKPDNVLVSVKIVIHANGEAFYVFKFEDDGEYDQIIAFNIWSRDKNAPVSAAVAKAFESE